MLSRHSEGLIALSACLRGDINETLLADRYDEAKRLARNPDRYMKEFWTWLSKL